MLSAEDDLADNTRPRLDAAGADVRRVHVLSAMRDTDRDTGEAIERSVSLRRDVPRLAAVLDGLPTCRMVVIDPISAYLDGTDSHANSDVRGLLAPLAELASRYRVALVAVTHLRKGEGRAIYRAIGSIAFAAAARFVAVVTRDPDDETRRLILPAKNNLGPDAGGLAYSITTTPEGVPHLAWAAEAVTMTADDALSPPPADDARTERDAAGEWLREVLTDGPMSARDLERLAREAGHAWRTVQRARERAGVISARDGFGRDARYRWRLASMHATYQGVASVAYMARMATMAQGYGPRRHSRSSPVPVARRRGTQRNFDGCGQYRRFSRRAWRHLDGGRGADHRATGQRADRRTQRRDPRAQGCTAGVVEP